MNFRSIGGRQRGVALVFAMILVLLMSTLAVSLIAITNAEVSSTMNYRLMVQARYAAEAGVQKAINYLIYSYTAPTSAQLTSYDLTKRPVQDTTSHNSVVLSGLSSISANYPDSSAQTAFNAALANQTVTSVTNATYSAAASLLEMRAITIFAGGSSYLPK